MASRETENNAYAKFGVTKKEHYGMLWYFLEWSIASKLVLWQLSVERVSRGRQPIDSYIDNIKRDTSLDSVSEIRSAMLDRNVWKDFVMKARSRGRPK